MAESWLVGRRGQALAVAALLLGLAALWFGAVAPVGSWYEDRSAQIAQQRDILERMRALAASVPTLKAAAARRRDDSANSGSVVLEAATDAVAAAELQERVQTMAAAAGVSLTSVETLPSEPGTGNWHKIALRVSLSASWPMLTALLRSAEQSHPRILIDDVHFHSTVAATYVATTPIQAVLVLYGFRLAGAGQGP